MVGTEAEVEVNLDAGVGDAIEQARNVVGILMMTSDCQFKTVKDYVIDLTWWQEWQLLSDSFPTPTDTFDDCQKFSPSLTIEKSFEQNYQKKLLSF